MKKSIMFALFLVVVAINMMWSFSIVSFAISENCTQSAQQLDTGQYVGDVVGKVAETDTIEEDKNQKPMVVFADFVFWKVIGEAVANSIKEVFQKIKNSRFLKVGKTRNTHKKKKKRKKEKKK